jgi:ribosomal protein S18 acetylase RimI-like enzyme
LNELDYQTLPVTTALRIDQAETAGQIETVSELFREYESWLGLDLCFQGFEEELRTLPGRYVPPDGRLYIASVNDTPAGCIAMRKLDKNICEMKRLYLRPEFRGRGIGNALIDKLIIEAKRYGYERMRLDTHPPKMGKAVTLYESYGFQQIPPYYDNPNKDVLFMELTL